MRKLMLSLAPLLAVAAFAVVPAAAQAQAHWYSNGLKLAENTEHKVRIQSFSHELKLIDKEIRGAPLVFEVKCEVYNLGKIWNPTGGGAGQDSIIQFAPVNPCTTNINAACTVAVFPETLAGVVSLPWASELEGGVGGPFHDKINGVAVTVQVGASATCGALANGELEYKLVAPEELKPKFNSLTTGTKAGCEAGTTSLAEFTAATGRLTSNAGTKGEIIGNVCIWGATEGQVIKVKNP